MERTTDISDKLHPKVQYLESNYRNFGAKINFSGIIATIKCFEDNSLVREAVAKDGTGKVLVVDAGGSHRCAMLGDMLAEKAIKNGWEGVVIYGLIRDSDILGKMQIGIKALGTHPLKSIKKGVGESNIEVNFSGVRFTPGDYIYADLDGVVVVEEKI
ncbi:MAG TPA: putative 4-hydroxy-4-methyl-2-oxoglutarate aldolase [Gammaproteobacteria bacterium]|jgi:regulator of ribonuclease activity A|nr:ribonuclease E activity regulator RraA [Gammaproteobacteria bacterium]HAY41229.1 putative 4-hydroxy-4-methyl-2-oxoglutarate aldolase [Gammaproteobacteria bacterium]|tara:strand:+ start:848 stop:1321 length:474 start_codon:yes stop_codon:yes gene_type:complete